MRERAMLMLDIDGQVASEFADESTRCRTAGHLAAGVAA